MTKFIITNLIFIVGTIALMLNHVYNWWLWGIYIFIWCLADYQFAKEIKLKWPHWLALLFLLTIIDWVVIKLAS